MARTISTLPDDGAPVFLFVGAEADAFRFKALSHELRGESFSQHLKITAAPDRHRALFLMRGRPLDRIYVDPQAVAAAEALDYKRSAR